MGSFPPLQLQAGLPSPGYVPGNNSQVDPQDEADRQEIERLRTTSDLWKTYSPEWDMFLSAYEGGPTFATEKNLFKHSRENDEDFLDRVKRIHYLNYCEPLIDFFTNFIYAETIQRNGGANDEYFQQFITNVNRKGASITDFMKEVSDDMQIYGHLYVLIDAPPLPDGQTYITENARKELGIEPYFVLIHPDEITDWVADDFDNFAYAKRKQNWEQMEGSHKHTFEKYTEWYPDHVDISFIDITDPINPKLRRDLAQTGLPNQLGEVPMMVVRYKRSKRWPFMGNSFEQDFAYNNREIMNLTSLIQEFLYRQCFNILAKEVEGNVPLHDQEDGVVGTANVMEVPKGANFLPAYISPAVDPAEFLQRERDYIKQEMFRRAAQDTLNELFNGEKSSGFSQAQSFAKTVPFIASRADTLEKVEIMLMQWVMKFKGMKWDGKIKYKDRYELTNLTDAITQLMMLARDMQLPSPTFVKEELKRLVQEYDGKLTTDTLQKVLKEIDALDFKQWQEVQKEALVGLPKQQGGTSPAAQHKPKTTGTMSEAKAESTKVNTSSTKKVKS